MSIRFLFSSLLTLVCAGAVWAVIAQRQELGHLRTEREVRLTALSADIASPAPSDVEPAEPAAAAAQAEGPSELLQLRGEVTRLTQQRQALANVVTENERLRSQLASRGTNVAPGMALPPGFIRKSQARNVGFGSPEDTVQTFLWAMQNHDFNTLLQALTPGLAQVMQSRVRDSGRSMDDFFRDTDAFIGMGVFDRKQRPDGSIEAKAQITSDSPPQTVTFQLVNGQWKMALTGL